MARVRSAVNTTRPLIQVRTPKYPDVGGEGDGGGLKGWINLKTQNKNCSTKFGQGLNPPPLRALVEFKLFFFKDGFPK